MHLVETIIWAIIFRRKNPKTFITKKPDLLIIKINLLF